MLRLDKTAIRKTTLHADQDMEDVLFWLTKTPDERMAAIEAIRLFLHIELGLFAFLPIFAPRWREVTVKRDAS